MIVRIGYQHRHPEIRDHGAQIAGHRDLDLFQAVSASALANVEKTTTALPGPAEFFKGVIPPNLFAAANNGDILPLTVFALLFGLALTRLAAPARKPVVAIFEAVGDAFVVIIDWVLFLAPLGVFALASPWVRRRAGRPSPASAIMS